MIDVKDLPAILARNEIPTLWITHANECRKALANALWDKGERGMLYEISLTSTRHDTVDAILQNYLEERKEPEPNKDIILAYGWENAPKRTKEAFLKHLRNLCDDENTHVMLVETKAGINAPFLVACTDTWRTLGEKEKAQSHDVERNRIQRSLILEAAGNLASILTGQEKPDRGTCMDIAKAAADTLKSKGQIVWYPENNKINETSSR